MTHVLPSRHLRARSAGVNRLRLGSQAFTFASAFNANIGAWNTASVTTLNWVCAAFSARAARQRGGTRSAGRRSGAGSYSRRDRRCARACAGHNAVPLRAIRDDDGPQCADDDLLIRELGVVDLDYLHRAHSDSAAATAARYTVSVRASVCARVGWRARGHKDRTHGRERECAPAVRDPPSKIFVWGA
jgi:hypothetical protein